MSQSTKTRDDHQAFGLQDQKSEREDVRSIEAGPQKEKVPGYPTPSHPTHSSATHGTRDGPIEISRLSAHGQADLKMAKGGGSGRLDQTNRQTIDAAARRTG